MVNLAEAIRNYKEQAVVITKDVIDYIKSNKDELVKAGIIKKVEFPGECTHCGRKGSIWLTIKNDDSTAVCIDCAEDVILNSSVEINCLSEGTGKMNYFQKRKREKHKQIVSNMTPHKKGS